MTFGTPAERLKLLPQSLDQGLTGPRMVLLVLAGPRMVQTEALAGPRMVLAGPRLALDCPRQALDWFPDWPHPLQTGP